MSRTNLVVIRAGDTSLHKEWLTVGSNRNWDLFVSWYGKSSYVPVADERWQAIAGGKWDGLARTFAAHGGLLEDYDYIWLPDDDIRTDWRAINRLFDVMKEERLHVAQPSLTANSYFSHLHTLNCPGMYLRYTNMVEIMIPCFDVRYLRLVLPYMSWSMSGFGLDWIWCRLSDENGFKSAILDCVAMQHTRPVGSSLKDVAAAAGEASWDGLERMLSTFGVPRKRTSAICYAGRTSNGIELGRFRTTLRMFLGHLRLRRLGSGPEWSFKRKWRLFVRANIRKLEFSRLQPAKQPRSADYRPGSR